MKGAGESRHTTSGSSCAPREERSCCPESQNGQSPPAAQSGRMGTSPAGKAHGRMAVVLCRAALQPQPVLLHLQKTPEHNSSISHCFAWCGWTSGAAGRGKREGKHVKSFRHCPPSTQIPLAAGSPTAPVHKKRMTSQIYWLPPGAIYQSQAGPAQAARKACVFD